MHRQIIRGLLLLLAAFSPALATPVIDVGTHYLLPSDQRTIAITTSGGDLVQGLNFYIQVADGGTINSGTATKPKITGIDIIGPGTLFSQSNTGSQPFHLPVSGGTYLIWQDTTDTQDDIYLAATGTLAYVTIDTAGTTSSDPAYPLILENVAASYNPPNGFTTDFAGVAATINAGQIVIVDLHQMKWNAAQDGNWTDTTWTNPLPPYPNYTAQAVVDTSYTVNVTSAQEANSLSLSNGGKVMITSTASLTLTNSATVSSGGTLSLASGAGLSTAGIKLSGGTISGSGTIAPAVTLGGGTLDAPLSSDNLILSAALDGTDGLTKTGSGTVTLLDNATYSGDTTISAGRLQLNGANSTLHAISGAGGLSLGNDTTPSIVTASSINLGSLRIGSGCKLIINPSVGDSPGCGTSFESVPEPSTITLLILAGIMGLVGYFRRRAGAQ